MQITRKMTFGMFENYWCPVCGEVTKTERITTGLPGILAQKCTKCGNHFQANYLESEDDLLTVPDSFIVKQF